MIGEDKLGNKGSVAKYGAWIYSKEYLNAHLVDKAPSPVKITAVKVGKGKMLIATITYKNKELKDKLPIDAEDKTATIEEHNFTVIRNNQLANGRARNQVKAIVTNAKSEVVEGIKINFSADNNAAPNMEFTETNAQGEALFNVANTKACTTTVTATVNNTTVKKTVAFSANRTTARVRRLEASKDNQPANGIAKNQVLAMVTDAEGNVISGMEVKFSTTGETKPKELSVITNDKGAALFEFAHIKAGTYFVYARANGKTEHIKVTFVADKATSTIEDANF